MSQQSLLGRQNTSSPQFKILRGVHETYARALETSLSSFLQSEIKVELGEITVLTLADFRKTLPSPACLIALRLHPRQDSMVLHFQSATVFRLLEFLLGGKNGPALAEARALTEIEWSLLEEVVRVMVRPLGEAWHVFHETEFAVESLESDPTLLPCPDPMRQTVRISYTLQIGEQTGGFEIAVPQAFFEPSAPAGNQEDAAPPAPNQADVDRNLNLLQNAAVELEVRLQGPTLQFEELMNLRPGHVLTFDYPLRKPLQGSVNGVATIEGFVVSSGRKRAFQIEEPL
jgi:flagellar motor switch protein FliM